MSKKTPAQNLTAEDAEEIAAFLQIVRPMKGTCRCDDDAFHSGRNCIEGYASAIRRGEGYTLTSQGCADVLHFLGGIEPMESCSYTNGTMEHAGYCRIVRYVEDHLRSEQGGAA